MAAVYSKDEIQKINEQVLLISEYPGKPYPASRNEILSELGAFGTILGLHEFHFGSGLRGTFVTGPSMEFRDTVLAEKTTGNPKMANWHITRITEMYLPKYVPPANFLSTSSNPANKSSGSLAEDNVRRLSKPAAPPVEDLLSFSRPSSIPPTAPRSMLSRKTSSTSDRAGSLGRQYPPNALQQERERVKSSQRHRLQLEEDVHRLKSNIEKCGASLTYEMTRKDEITRQLRAFEEVTSQPGVESSGSAVDHSHAAESDSNNSDLKERLDVLLKTKDALATKMEEAERSNDQRLLLSSLLEVHGLNSN